MGHTLQNVLFTLPESSMERRKVLSAIPQHAARPPSSDSLLGQAPSEQPPPLLFSLPDQLTPGARSVLGDKVNVKQRGRKQTKPPGSSSAAGRDTVSLCSVLPLHWQLLVSVP